MASSPSRCTRRPRRSRSARRSSSRCRPAPTRSTRPRSAPATPRTSRTSYLGDLANRFADDRCSPRGRLPERSAAGRSRGPDPDAPRQRVLEHAAPGRSSRDAAAGVELGDVRGARHVHLLLPGPPVHEGHGRRPVRRAATIVALMAVTGAATSVAAPAASAAVREYWVAAVAAPTWNMVAQRARRDPRHAAHARRRPSSRRSSTAATARTGTTRCATSPRARATRT